MLTREEAARTRREISWAVNSFCLQYAIMDMVEQIRKNPSWWMPSKGKGIAEQLLEYYESKK